MSNVKHVSLQYSSRVLGVGCFLDKILSVDLKVLLPLTRDGVFLRCRLRVGRVLLLGAYTQRTPQPGACSVDLRPPRRVPATNRYPPKVGAITRRAECGYPAGIPCAGGK